MTIQECYCALGSDYTHMAERIPGEDMAKRFIAKFLDDDSFLRLCRAMAEGRREEAFCAALTLKSVCGNLSFDKLCDSTSRLMELLRPECEASIPAAADALLEEVRGDYAFTVQTIQTYLHEDKA